MSQASSNAPGRPGVPPTWTTSAKAGVGTALTASSRVWFTLCRGILTEVYYPHVDRASTRDLGFLVTDRRSFFSEEKCDTTSRVRYLAPGVPAFRLVNVCNRGRYRIEKTVLADPDRSVVLQHVRFVPLEGKLEDYALYALLAPHLGDQGHGNTAWLGDYKGTPMLFARREDNALALACSAPWLRRSAGYAGVSDGWQDLHRHRQMTWVYDRAEDGNVALTGEIDLRACGGEFVLALGFGNSDGEAGRQARASLLAGFGPARKRYVKKWRKWLKGLLPLAGSKKHPQDLYRLSAAVLRVHEDKEFQGGIIASLSVPWGCVKGDKQAAGYHLVWPRDLAESAGALLAAGTRGDARRVLFGLQVTQDADGHWPQNMWLDGDPHWNAQQMDETALAVLLVGLVRRERTLKRRELKQLWPMVRLAVQYLVRFGPVSQEDRWEEDPGYSPFTLAAEVAALLVAADLADDLGKSELSGYLRETADAWNDCIERWIYAVGTDLARRVGVDGYYVRIAPPDEPELSRPAAGTVPVRNRPTGRDRVEAVHMVSPDALALVRFGLRAADDPRIVNTVRVIDSLLKVDTPSGPAWHRYNGDGYGEHADGSPFDGTGVGRAWPLLTGERAHYELAAGRPKAAEALVRTMEGFASESGLIPEQVWDTADIPERGLYLGRPSGSAMPLVWAHAEYVKLRRSLHEGRVFDMPTVTVRRYVQKKTTSPHHVWRFNQKTRTLPRGKVLRVEVMTPAVVHWSTDGWQTARDTPAQDTGWGVFLVDLPTSGLPAGSHVDFTFRWTKAGHWEGTNFQVTVTDDVGRPAGTDGHQGPAAEKKQPTQGR